MFGLMEAPEINRMGVTWFNVERPLSLRDLRGRLVILEFWTMCCVNCLHLLPTLRRIGERFPDEAVVIGVHSPKFAAERDPVNLVHAIARHDIRHPVAHDPTLTLWQDYHIHAWPTLMLIDPEGGIVGSLAGEAEPQRLLDGIGAMIGDWKAKGTIDPKGVPVLAAAEVGARLRFPGRIKPLKGKDGAKAWAIADSGHHQIVIADDTGAEIGRFGSGRAGFFDGDGEGASFNSPQGLVCGLDDDGNGVVYVADTGNHTIRRLDPGTGAVSTLAGAGVRGAVLGPPEPADRVELASVWDLELAGSRLMFANAGSHQLGELDLASGQVRSLAGSSAEAITDGPALEAELAEPSGLTLDATGGVLYFTDRETSSVRSLTLNGADKVETLIGTGLFDFGHANGPFPNAKFQHPLGLAWRDGGLVVADTYNGCLRLLDLENRQVRDLEEATFACTDTLCRPTSGLAGVSADGANRLLVADTNNHRILEIFTEERTVRTWME